MKGNMSRRIRIRPVGIGIRRPFPAALIAVLVAAVLAPAGVVHAAAPPVTIGIEPFVGGKLVVGRLAPSAPG